MKCNTFDLGCKLDQWFMQKWNAIAMTFWNSLDTVALSALGCCLFLSLFGLESPKKWTWWIIGVYVLLKVLQYANRTGAI